MSRAECRTALCKKTIRIGLAVSEASTSLSKTATETVVLNLSRALSGLVSSCRFGRRLGKLGAGHRVVTKLGPLCKVTLLNNQVDKLVVRSPHRTHDSAPRLLYLSLEALATVGEPLIQNQLFDRGVKQIIRLSGDSSSPEKSVAGMWLCSTPWRKPER